MKNVVEMVEAGTCTGCLMCLSLCPNDNLIMENGNLGFPVPHVKNDELCKGCNECIKGCPFSNEADD